MAENKKEEKKAETKLSANQQKVLDLVEKMSALELSTLVSAIEDTFGVTAAAPMAVAAAPAAGGDAQAEEDTAKSSYTIELTDAGEQKMAVLKAVKAATGLGLKEAKDLVDKAPTAIKEDVPAEEAEEIKKTIEEAGGKAELK